MTLVDEATRDTRESVSVVIPVGDRPSDLARVLEQVPEFADEVVIVDGGSLNGELAAARAVRPDLRVVFEPAPGRSAVRAGFAAATGDCVVLLDPAQRADPIAIARFVSALRAGSSGWLRTA
jgi:glycosyltransferase involved in cell wall biosynthesis